MHNQRGMGLSGVLVIVILVVAFGIMLMKAVPAYLEYLAIKKTFVALKAESKSGSVKSIKEKFNAHAAIDDFKSITADDLEISKEGGEVIVSANYQKVIPLFANVSLLLDFAASTKE
jgi:Domain of unknown function (DUF4845)